MRKDSVEVEGSFYTAEFRGTPTFLNLFTFTFGVVEDGRCFFYEAFLSL